MVLGMPGVEHCDMVPTNGYREPDAETILCPLLMLFSSLCRFKNKTIQYGKFLSPWMNQCRSQEAPSNKQFQVKKLKGTLFTCCFFACFVTFEQKCSSKCSLRQFPGWTSCSQQSNRSYFDSSKRVPQNGIKWKHSNGN